MNRIFKRKLVFCKSLFTVQFYPIYKRGKKNLKKKKKKKTSAGAYPGAPFYKSSFYKSSPVQSSPVQKYSIPFQRAKRKHTNMASSYPALYFRVILLLFLASLVSGRPVLSATSYPQVIYQGHPTSIFGKYLFGRRFKIQHFRNISCKISCLPASPGIFEHLKNGIITHF